MRHHVMLTGECYIYNTETNWNLSGSFENSKFLLSRRETEQREHALVDSVVAEGRMAAVYSEGFLDLSLAKILFSCQDLYVI